MNSPDRFNRNLSLLAFILGLAAVTWVAVGYVGGSALAFTVSCLIATVYLAGAFEMRRFHGSTSALARALGNIPDEVDNIGEWLQQVPVNLQNAVRLRIAGERVVLPGPGVTPYLIGLLVLLGMLGTFLGMVVTLKGAVIALESTTDLHAIRSALAAPVRGLGVAFGTSVAGVATSAMLGLLSTLARRDRQQVAQLLDSKIAGALRDFSFVHQRQQTFKALQTQAQSLPNLVDKLDTMISQMAEQNRQLGEQLLAGQRRFHEEAKGLYTDLAESVDRSLKASLRESSTAAAEAIQPIVTTTMADIAAETRDLHDKLLGTAETQLASGAGQFTQTVASVSENWSQALARHEQATDAQRRDLQGALTAYVDTFEQRSAALLASVETTQARLHADAAQQHAAFAATATASQQQLASTFTDHFDGLTARLNRAVAQVADTFADRSATLLEEQRTAQITWRSEWTAGEEARQARFTDALTAMADRLEAQWQQAGENTLAQQEEITRTLGATARELVAATRHQAETTIAEITRLMQTAAEAPKAAAEVIGELRHELSASMARDNSLLEERNRIMETLGALLDAINHASTEQRGAIDALVASSAELLQRVGNQFTNRVESEAGKLVEVGASVAGSALEVASLGEAFGHAVQLFSDSNEKMMTALQRIEGGLAKSLTRSDEQLAYYVAQAREIIELSILSQKKMVDDLQRSGRIEA
jgi:hypothetical protein